MGTGDWDRGTGDWDPGAGRRLSSPAARTTLKATAGAERSNPNLHPHPVACRPDNAEGGSRRRTIKPEPAPLPRCR
jgi:hypothetical protein